MGAAARAVKVNVDLHVVRFSPSICRVLGMDEGGGGKEYRETESVGDQGGLYFESGSMLAGKETTE